MRRERRILKEEEGWCESGRRMVSKTEEDNEREKKDCVRRDRRRVRKTREGGVKDKGG